MVIVYIAYLGMILYGWMGIVEATLDGYWRLAHRLYAGRKKDHIS